MLPEARPQRAQVGEVPPDLLERGGPSIVRDRPLVARETGEQQVRRGRDATRDGEGLLGATAPGATARVAELEQHGQGTRGRLLPQDSLEQLDPSFRVHVARELVRVIAEVVHRPPDRGGVGERVRDEDPRDAGRPHHPGLRRRRRGDPPGPRVELPPPELRRHRGLAVRGDRHLVLVAVRGHQRDVVFERRTPDHDERRLQVVQRPALAASLEQWHRVGDPGYPLARPVDPDVAQEPRRRGAHRAKRGRCSRFASRIASSRPVAASASGTSGFASSALSASDRSPVTAASIVNRS